MNFDLRVTSELGCRDKPLCSEHNLVLTVTYRLLTDWCQHGLGKSVKYSYIYTLIYPISVTTWFSSSHYVHPRLFEVHFLPCQYVTYLAPLGGFSRRPKVNDRKAGRKWSTTWMIGKEKVAAWTVMLYLLGRRCVQKMLSIISWAHGIDQKHSISFPILGRVGCNHLAIPASSVTVWQLSSSSWQTCTDIGNSLKGQTVAELMCACTRQWTQKGCQTLRAPFHTIPHSI